MRIDRVNMIYSQAGYGALLNSGTPLSGRALLLAIVEKNF